MSASLSQLPLAKIAKKYIVRSANRLKRQERVAMFHVGRVGSSVLGDMLDQNKGFYWSGEPFERYMVDLSVKNTEFASRVIQNSLDEAICNTYVFATKFLRQQHLASHCINMTLESYVSLLKEMGFTKFIVISRKNHLRRVASIEVGRKKNQWHSKENVVRATKVTIPLGKFQAGQRQEQTEHLIDYFRDCDVQFSSLVELLPKDDTLYLTYEQDIENDPFVAYARVGSFLGISLVKPVINYKKTNPFDLEDLIENYDEIEAALSTSEYRWMLR